MTEAGMMPSRAAMASASVISAPNSSLVGSADDDDPPAGRRAAGAEEEEEEEAPEGVEALRPTLPAVGRAEAGRGRAEEEEAAPVGDSGILGDDADGVAARPRRALALAGGEEGRASSSMAHSVSTEGGAEFCMAGETGAEAATRRLAGADGGGYINRMRHGDKRSSMCTKKLGQHGRGWWAGKQKWDQQRPMTTHHLDGRIHRLWPF